MSIISLSTIFLIILSIIFIIIGIWFKKLTTSSDDFLLAGRATPFWIMAAAYLGANLGGSSISGFMGTSYESGMSSIWPAILPTVGIIVFIFLFVRKLNYFGRKVKAVTISDFLCERYGEKVRFPSAIIAFFRPGFLTGLQLLAIAVVLEVAFGLPKIAGVAIAAVVILAYLLTAGQYSALVTQWIQAIFQSLAIMVVGVAAIKLAGGVVPMTETLYSIMPEKFVNSLVVDPSLLSVWILSMGLFYLVDPWIYMWSYMGESPKVSQNAQLATLGAQFYSIFAYIAGIAVACAVFSGKLTLPENLAPDGIYTWLSLNKFSTGIGTFLIVGLLMTIISCGTSFVMNGTTIITNDIYKHIINKKATEKQMLTASRISIVIVILVGCIAALWLPILVPLWVLAQALALSGLLAPTLSAWFWKRSTGTAALASIILGGIAGFLWALYAWVTTGNPGTIINGLHACHVGLIVSIPVMVIVSLITKPDSEEMVNKTNYKVLGKELQQYNANMGIIERKGFFGFLGAETTWAKIGWITVTFLFIMHIVPVLLFKIQWIGTITIWLCILVCIGMAIVFGILGGLDIKKLTKRTKSNHLNV